MHRYGGLDYLAEECHALNQLTFNAGVCFYETVISQNEQIIILSEIRKLTNIPKFIEGFFEIYNRIVKSLPPSIIKGLNPNCIYGILDEDNKHVLLIDLEKIITKQETQIISNLDSVIL
jgi:chemotaxis signal transduction protein